MSRPTISLITSVRNNRPFIREAIESVLSQTYPSIEYIVVDGASTDGTLDIIQSYAGRIAKIISEPDLNCYDGMNKGIQAATGDIIGTLNSDDIFFDHSVIEKVAQAFRESAELDCVYGNLIFVDRENPEKITRRWISKPFQEGLFEKSWTPAHPTFYCKKSVFTRLGGYRLDYKIAADVELMYRFIQKNHIYSRFLPFNFIKMRTGGLSTRGLQSTWTITLELKKAITENQGSFSLIKYLFYKALKLREFG